MLYERVIAAIVPTAGIERAYEVKSFFEDYLKKSDKAKDVIKLSLERLEINLRMRSSSQRLRMLNMRPWMNVQAKR